MENVTTTVFWKPVLWHMTNTSSFDYKNYPYTYMPKNKEKKIQTNKNEAKFFTDLVQLFLSASCNACLASIIWL